MSRVTCIAALLTLASLGCERSLPPDVAPNIKHSLALRDSIGGKAVVAEAAATTAAVDPDGWADVSGRVALDASVPPGAGGTTDKDVGVCMKDGHKIPFETVITGAENGLKNVLIYVANKEADTNPKWVHESYEAGKSEPFEFDQKLCVFLRHVAVFRTTQPLKILNSDPVGHNTNIPDLNFNQTIVANGSQMLEAKKALNKPAGVSCSIHPFMSAWLFSRNHPYCAVTDADGKFTMKNVPTGVDLEFRIWHEKTDYVKGGKLGGAEAKWPQGKMKLKLAAGEAKSLEIQLKADSFK